MSSWSQTTSFASWCLDFLESQSETPHLVRSVFGVAIFVEDDFLVEDSERSPDLAGLLVPRLPQGRRRVIFEKGLLFVRSILGALDFRGA